jgi:hypothetical protein
MFSMSYHEERQILTCGKCGAVNHMLMPDSRANERETAASFSCGSEIAAEKCWVIFAAGSAEEAVGRLRRVQNRS